MSAETLRRAAALMRERATHPDMSSSPWFASPHGDVHDDGSLWVCDSQSGEAAEHIASWHPAVALAVADWLDAEAAEYERLRAQSFAVNILLATADEEIEARVSLGYHTLDKALAVARAYLGESS